MAAYLSEYIILFFQMATNNEANDQDDTWFKQLLVSHFKQLFSVVQNISCTTHVSHVHVLSQIVS